MLDELDAINALLGRITQDPVAAAAAASQLRGQNRAIRWKLVRRTRTLEPCVIWHVKEGQPIILWIGNADLTTLA